MSRSSPAIMGGDSEAIPGHLQSNLSSSDLSSYVIHDKTSTPGPGTGTGAGASADPSPPPSSSSANTNGKTAMRPTHTSLPPEKRYQLSLGRSNPQDADDVLSIAVPVFTQTFAHTCSSEDMALYLNTHFTVEHILAELNNPNKRFMIAYDTTDTAPSPSLSSSSGSLSSSTRGTCAGFAQLTIGSSEPCVDQLADKVELQRIYVSTDHHGSGLARLLMDAALSVAKSEGYKNIWLGVLKGNTRAEKFYQKFGFEKVGEHDFYLGSDRQTDDILVRSL